jgi:hypothetical protein
MAKVETIAALVIEASKRFSLSVEEMCKVMGRAVELRYDARGENVIAIISYEDGHVNVDIRQLRDVGGAIVERAPLRYLMPTHEDLLRAIELNRKDSLGATPWNLVRAKIISEQDDCCLIEVIDDEQQGDKQVAVLPHIYMHEHDSRLVGSELFVVIQKHFPDKSKSGTLDEWMAQDVPLMASRVDRQLVIQVINQFFGIETLCVVQSGAAMVMLEPTADLAKLIAEGGKNRILIERCTGFKRVFFVRLFISRQDKEKLIKAVMYVTGLHYPAQFHVAEPIPDDPTKDRWKIYVNPDAFNRFIGKGGQNIFFIMYLTNLQITYKTRRDSNMRVVKPKGPAPLLNL